MADISAEAEVTLYQGSTSVNIIISPRIVHNWDKPQFKPILLPYLLNNEIATSIVDLGMNKFVITVDGIIRDDDSTTAETRISNLYTLFNSQSNVYIKWGAGTTSVANDTSSTIYQNDNGVTQGSILKVEIRETFGRANIDWSARCRRGGTCSINPTTNTSYDLCKAASGTWTAYGKMYEVTVQFLVGDILKV